MRAARCLVAVLAFGLSAVAGATVPAAGAVALGSPAVRVCYNDQLGPPDGGHFSLQLMRGVVAAKPALRFELQPLPWVRCLILASRGDVDAILGASFTPERALDLVYPRDARGGPDDARRLFAQGYRLLRRQGDDVDTDGQRFIGLVGPMGVERGHSTGAFVRAGGAEADDNHPDMTAMLEKLRTGRLGGALVAEPQYASLRVQAGALDGLEAAPTMIQPRGYFLVFSSSFARREPGVVEQLWAEAARQRDTPVIRREIALQQGATMEGERP